MPGGVDKRQHEFGCCSTVPWQHLQAPVASTVQVTDEVLVDLDDKGVAVGVEILRLDGAANS